ncbi:MAG: hypothetical protein AWU54_1195 [Candidatus Frackibacter sp. T328-2]|jgi:hypothetical protein|nr:MAG: hypothetical protein AWU54_1195 [Candidatus Frackibacter sp. T328-2]
MADRKVLDILMSADDKKIKFPKKRVKIKRLSEALGDDVIFTVRAISAPKYESIQEKAIKIKDKNPDIDVNEMQLFTVLEGVVDPNLKDSKLREQYNAPTPKELVNKLLLPGEITRLYGEIADLSGFGDKAVEEVKN